jgi:arginase family enzyme
MAWLNFLDLRSLPAKEAEAVILPIPYEATTTYGAGTRQGPGGDFGRLPPGGVVGRGL